MSEAIRGIMEDQRKGILLQDFSGGIITDTGGLSLAPNQSPDSWNVFAWEGQLHFRGGYSQFSTLPAAADGAYTYYDRSLNKHMVEWAAGNLYEVTSGTPVVIASGVYTPGETIAHAQLNGIMYWSTTTVPIRQWDGVTEQATPNSGGTGSVAVPACRFLVVFNGALIAVNVVVAGVPNPGAFMWSNVNDPTTWIGANTQEVGSNDGGECVFALLMGIAQVGVTPTKQFMVGKNNRQMFLYQGALTPTGLTENAISSPVGILDGKSAVYIPTKQGLGAIAFLGDDAQFYLCNGIETVMISDGIKTLAYNLVNAAMKTSPTLNFNGVYNQRYQYYMCDLGDNTQLVYKWDTSAWWLFQGWPSGPYLSAPSENGLPAIFVGSNYPGVTGVYELGLDKTNDNGTRITAYFTTPYIHGGKPERLKIFQEVTMFAYNIGVQYKVTATGLPLANNLVQVSTPLIFNDPAVGAISTSSTDAALWGIARWGLSRWGGSQQSIAQPYAISAFKGPIVVPSTVTKWARAGMPLPMRTGACQFKIAYNAGVPDFRMSAFKIAFLPQNEAVGVLPFSQQGQMVTNISAAGNALPGNPFTNTGLPLPVSPVPPVSASPPGPPVGTILDYTTDENAALLASIASGKNSIIQRSPDGAYIYLAVNVNSFSDSYIRKIDAFTGAVVASTPLQVGKSAHCMVISPDGTKLFCNSRFFKIYSYQTSDMSLLNVQSYPANLSTVQAIDVSPDGTKIALIFVGPAAYAVCVMDTSTYACTTFTIPGNYYGDYGCFAPSGNLYITDGLVTVGDLYIREYTTSGGLVQTFTIGLPADNSKQVAPFGVNPLTGIIYGYQQASDKTLFTYDPSGGGSLIGSTVITGSDPHEIQGLAFDLTNASTCYLTTEDARLIALDQSGAVAGSTSLSYAGTEPVYFTCLTIANGVAYVSAASSSPDYYALICIAAV